MFCIHCNHISFLFFLYVRNNYKLQHTHSHTHSYHKNKFHQTKKSRYVYKTALQFHFTTIAHIWLMELEKRIWTQLASAAAAVNRRNTKCDKNRKAFSMNMIRCRAVTTQYTYIGCHSTQYVRNITESIVFV